MAKNHRQRARVARLVRRQRSKFFDALIIADLVRRVLKIIYSRRRSPPK
jgi:hypothetical protein